MIEDAAFMSAHPLLGPRTDIEGILAAIPYAQFLGMSLEHKDGTLTLSMRFQPHIIGNPVLPAIHGGVIGSFLETTALLELIWQMPMEHVPKPVDIAIDFLRSGRPIDTFARATITKRGRRVANVHAEAWQDDPTRPIAALHGHFLVAQSP